MDDTASASSAGRRGPLGWSAEQTRVLEEAVRAGRPACCPCGTLMDARLVPPRSDVAYVRDRVWLACPACGRTLVIDRRAT